MGQERSGVVLAHLVAANGGTAFLLLVDLYEWGAYPVWPGAAGVLFCLWRWPRALIGGAGGAFVGFAMRLSRERQRVRQERASRGQMAGGHVRGVVVVPTGPSLLAAGWEGIV